jgi:hypothetical protein
MKKILLISILALSFSLPSTSQVIILCENFNVYDSTTAAINYHGWYVSYNHPQNSYYTSLQSSGPSGPNSYKLGVDSATLVTPNIDGATHIQFWTKGNATDSISTLYVYDTTDSVSWNLLQVINPINTNSNGLLRQLTLSFGARNVKFFYDKSVGNCAFDDFCATIGPASIQVNGVLSNPSFFPNPSSGSITLSASNPRFNACQVTILNLLGKEVRSFSFSDLNTSDKKLDLSMLDKGVYLIRFKSENSEHTQRLILED